MHDYRNDLWDYNYSVYSVCFFGHRYIADFRKVERSLENTIRKIIENKRSVEFLVGRNGDFDQMVSSTVRRLKREMQADNCYLVLMLPYATAEYVKNEKSFHDYYDEVEICEASERSHPKGAITARNRYMVQRSELVVCCVEKQYGGAYNAVKYAKQIGKSIINLALES